MRGQRKKREKKGKKKEKEKEGREEEEETSKLHRAGVNLTTYQHGSKKESKLQSCEDFASF